MEQVYDCNYSKFDLEKHKEVYPNYCEVVIRPDGEICYAHPSHQQYLELLAAQVNRLSIQEVYEGCPENMYADYLRYLVDLSGAVSCWTDFYMLPNNNKLTESQIRSLNTLIEEGLVKDRLRG